MRIKNFKVCHKSNVELHLCNIGKSGITFKKTRLYQMRPFYIMSFFLLGFLMLGCKNEVKSASKTFDVDLLLKELTEQLILPTMKSFESESETLSQKIGKYAQKPTMELLDSIRSQWTQTAYAYERAYNFHFGPAKSQFIHRAIYNWPTVSETIESTLETGKINEETMGKLSPQIKGLAAMEYLLFKGDLAKTHSEMVSQRHRREYLQQSATYLNAQAERLFLIWDVAGQNYAETFISNEQQGIRSSFNLLFNGLYNAANIAKITKVGKPAGLENSPRTNPKKVQAPYSNESLALLSESIGMIEEVYFGTGHANISEYVTFLADEDIVNQRVETSFKEIKVAIAAISGPLEEAVDTQPAKVEELHQQLTALNVWMGVDVRSILNIIMTSTDTDGD